MDAESQRVANLSRDLAMTVRMADDAWCDGLRGRFASYMVDAVALANAGGILADDDDRAAFAYLYDRYKRR